MLNVAGGTAVLGSYLLVFSLEPQMRSGLWGGVPEAAVPLYTTNMLLAAAGYFPFSVLLILRTRPDAFEQLLGRPYRLLHLLYGLVLIPSALWLPLTAWMLQSPSPWLWGGIRAVLLLVGLGSTGLLAVAIAMARRAGGTLAWLAVGGAFFFWTQTAVLDALVWPAFW
ncbi:MAG: hypothetical protein QNK03_08140 [Myxococcota bacterium]|nr:hypothetical protein [Myxococcota bacterium]